MNLRDPKTIFTICFVGFVILSFVVAGLIYRRQERRERPQRDIRDRRPHLFC